MKIVVFAGGVGSRLWPLSRKNTPKQFGKILGERSTLQQTVERLLPSFTSSDIYVATGKHYTKTIKEQLPYIPDENFLFEPMMRDVGPAIGLVSALLNKKFSDEPIAILWSDHIMKQEDKFREMLLLAEEKVASKKSDFVFIAQKPRFANQNCGWIELGKKVEEKSGGDIYEFKMLRYRPALEEAEEFFSNKNFVWNLGYFVTTPHFLMSLFKEYVPEMYEGLSKIAAAEGTEKFATVLEEVYPTLEKISFDDAILVKLQPEKMLVISADLGWSDVGTWDALKEALSLTQDENVTNGKVLLENTSDSLVFNYSNQLTVGIDLKEMIIINTEDVVLVCPKSAVPQIKKFVEKLGGTPFEDLV